jgi:polar amino acid transport system substrate-binding protein
MITIRHLIAFLFLILPILQGSTAFAMPVTPIVRLLLSEELDEKNVLTPIPKEAAAIIRYLEASIDLRFDVRRYPWKRALENTKNGEGIIFGISKTPERLQKFIFSEPVFTDQIWLVTRCDSVFEFKKLQDLKGKTIGIVRGASFGDEFDQQSNVLFKVEDDTGANHARFMKLYNRRMDALTYYQSNTDARKLETSLNESFAQKKIPGTAEKSNRVFCVLPKPVSSLSIHFAISKDQDTRFFNMIDNALLRAKNNGDLARIFHKENQ